MKFDPAIIPSFQKSRHLKSLTEDEFRDLAVRPLFLRKGLVFGADLCGPNEAGKDSLFTVVDPLGSKIIYFIQTKKGNLNLARLHENNVQEAITQLRTGFTNTIVDTISKMKCKANFGILCVSGSIGASARQHIFDEVKEQNLRFMDSDDLIPEIDKFYPEFWQGIEPDHYPYLNKLHDSLVNTSELISISNAFAKAEAVPIVTDEGFASLRLSRMYLKPKKVDGQITQETIFEDISCNSLLDQDAKHFLVLGDAGSGKSTILRRLAEIEVQKNLNQLNVGVLPALIRCLDITKSHHTLAELLIHNTVKFTQSGKPAFGVRELSDGRVAVLIDALDEVANDSDKENVLMVIRKFVEDYPKCSVVITSRDHSIVGRSEFLRRFKFYRVLPIGWKEAQKIVHSLDRNKRISNDATKEIIRQLEDVHGIELNPLLVTIFVASADATRRDVPANITELFSKFCETMLGRWDTDKGLSQQFEAPLKDLLLCKLAHKMHNERVTSISEDACLHFLENELAVLGKKKLKIQELINEMLVRSGLLRLTENGYEFIHLIIQEYFAGRQLSSIDEVSKHCADEWWRRPIIFYFGAHPKDGEGLLRIACDLTNKVPQHDFNSAVTLGLATQACYFVPVAEKAEILKCVILGLSRSREIYTAKSELNPEGKSLGMFLYHYLVGREAVGSDVLEVIDNTEQWLSSNDGPNDQQYIQFWAIVGLIESNQFDKAESALKNFVHKATDAALILAIHLGAFMIVRTRISTPECKKKAQAISDKVAPYVVHLRKQLHDEIKTELLELRTGKLFAIKDDVTPKG